MFGTDLNPLSINNVLHFPLSDSSGTSTRKSEKELECEIAVVGRKALVCKNGHRTCFTASVDNVCVSYDFPKKTVCYQRLPKEAYSQLTKCLQDATQNVSVKVIARHEVTKCLKNATKQQLSFNE